MLAVIAFLIFSYMFPVLAFWLTMAYIGWLIVYVTYKVLAFFVNAFTAPAEAKAEPTSYELELQRADRIVQAMK